MSVRVCSLKPHFWVCNYNFLCGSCKNRLYSRGHENSTSCRLVLTFLHFFIFSLPLLHLNLCIQRRSSLKSLLIAGRGIEWLLQKASEFGHGVSDRPLTLLQLSSLRRWIAFIHSLNKWRVSRHLLHRMKPSLFFVMKPCVLCISHELYRR